MGCAAKCTTQQLLQWLLGLQAMSYQPPCPIWGSPCSTAHSLQWSPVECEAQCAAAWGGGRVG